MIWKCWLEKKEEMERRRKKKVVDIWTSFKRNHCTQDGQLTSMDCGLCSALRIHELGSPPVTAEQEHRDYTPIDVAAYQSVAIGLRPLYYYMKFQICCFFHNY
ncbi:hypothetical protein JTB14_003870 [Gonioctena quinquepunctata]|nr:hypothetical protein JTB14_003870 [Gonioctena quinquepunctata]